MAVGLRGRLPAVPRAVPGAPPARGAAVDVVDLNAGSGRGPLWGVESEDLNATLLAWPAGESTPEHVNDERDVLLVVVAGGGTLELDGEPQALAAPAAVVIAKGRRRRVLAGGEGIRYLSAHVRRGGLQIGRGA